VKGLVVARILVCTLVVTSSLRLLLADSYSRLPKCSQQAHLDQLGDNEDFARVTTEEKIKYLCKGHGELHQPVEKLSSNREADNPKYLVRVEEREKWEEASPIQNKGCQNLRDRGDGGEGVEIFAAVVAVGGLEFL